MARAALFLIATFIVAPPASAGPTNGDFESALTTGWSDTSTHAGEAVRVAEGDSFSTHTSTGSIGFVSPSHAVLLRGGHDGVDRSDGAVQSDRFTVTHQSLSIWQQSETAAVSPRTFLVDDAGSTLFSITWSPSVGSFTEHAIDVSTWCEADIRVLLTSTTENASTPDPDAFTLFDDVQLTGPLCPRYADNDGDLFCGQGIDINQDGDCLDPGEVFGATGDCDDTDDSIYPNATEIPGDGIDQDCNGVDLAGPRTVSGAVFEDMGADGRVQGDGRLPGVAITVYRDDGDNLPSSFDHPLTDAATTTDASGDFALPGLAAEETYFLVFDASTVASDRPARPGRTLDAAWAEQTWASAGGMCADGSGGGVFRSVAGPCFGGREAGRSDLAANIDFAEHIVRVRIEQSDVPNLGVAFSFDVVTHPLDGDDDLGTSRVMQGSFRQFVENVNALGGPHTMRFVPAVPPTDTSPEGAWWSVDLVFPIPALRAPGLELDGTAWCNGFDCTVGTVRDINPGFFAPPSGIVGVGPDLVPESGDEPVLSGVARPELEIDGDNQGAIECDEVIFVHDVALHRMGLDLSAVASRVENSVIGPSASGPSSEITLLDGIHVAADDIEVRGNWIEVEGTAIRRAGSFDGLWVEQNTIVAPPGGHTDAWPGIHLEVPTVADTALGDLIIDNAIEGLGGPALLIDGPGSVLDLRFSDNSVVANGFLDTGLASTEPAGVVVDAVQGDSLELNRNLVWANAGAGIVVRADAVGVVATANAMADNGGAPFDLGDDGPTPNDGGLALDEPNDGLDAPVVTGAWIDGAGQVRVVGYVGLAAAPFSEALALEWFLADDDGNQDGSIELGDGASVPRGETWRHLFFCDTLADGTFDCAADAATAGVEPLDTLVGQARRTTGSSEAGNVFTVILDSDDDGLSDEDELTVWLSDPFDVDSDDDALTDGDEVRVHLTSPIEADTDGDLLSDGDEVNATGTDPLLADTDGGGIDDGTELLLALTDPHDPTDDVAFVDTDRDMLSDDDEAIYKTDPANPDTDGDGLLDGQEVRVEGSDPLIADTDGDTLSDGDEVLVHLTDPNLLDTDGGGLDDGVEVLVVFTNPLDPSDDDPNLIDTDDDGLSDPAETDVHGTDPLVPDTDSDGLLDGDEVLVHFTDPLVADTDGDGIDDGDEVARGLDPNLSDTDGGGVQDGVEILVDGTDPTDPTDDRLDTDGDGLLDSEEAQYGSDPAVADTDGDGLLDGPEVDLGTDPLVADTDGGGIDDGTEVEAGTDPLDPTDDAEAPGRDPGPLTGGSGCQCSSSAAPPWGSGILVLLALVGLTKRRR